LEHYRYTISVLIPVYNCAQYVTAALNSILTQTFPDFEVLIIDDGSTDNTVHLIKDLDDPRITLIQKPHNTGITDSLNMGIELAQGKFIARMDGDDISVSTRFEEQVAFLEHDPSLVVCGSWTQILSTGEIIKRPVEHDEIKTTLLVANCVLHPTVMIRTSFLRDNNLKYNRLLEPSEDYDLWVRMIKKGRFYNIPKALLMYRLHDSQTSEQKRSEQNIKANTIRCVHLSSLTTMRSALKFYDVNRARLETSQKKKMAILNWLIGQKTVLASKNDLIGIFNREHFDVFLTRHVKAFSRTVFLNSASYNPRTLLFFMRHVARHPDDFSPREVLKTLVKCLVFYKAREA
jgi:glycosyltransferase involved in cell wall biosynthesis